MQHSGTPGPLPDCRDRQFYWLSQPAALGVASLSLLQKKHQSNNPFQSVRLMAVICCNVLQPNGDESAEMLLLEQLAAL